MEAANINEKLSTAAETLLVQAEMQAAELLADRDIEDLEGQDRITAVVELMEELAANNANRYVVEALARDVTAEQATLEYQTTMSRLQQVS